MLPAGTRVIVAAGRGFAVTAAAIKACIADNVELLISDDAQTFVSMFALEPTVDASHALKLRCAQSAAMFDKVKTVRIAREIVRQKIASSNLPDKTHKPLLSKLRLAHTVLDVRAVEAKAAEADLGRWYGTPLLFKGTVPDAWRIFGARM